MQEVWAKILADEITQPGRIIYRTLEVLSNLNNSKAKNFKRLCSLISDNKFIWKLNGQMCFSKYDVSFTDIMTLRDIGLAQYGDHFYHNLQPEKSDDLEHKLSSNIIIGKTIWFKVILCGKVNSLTRLFVDFGLYKQISTSTN